MPTWSRQLHHRLQASSPSQRLHHTILRGTRSISSSAHPMTSIYRPPWLHSLLSSQSPPPKLYAWTPSNLDDAQSIPQRHQTPSTNHKNDQDRRIYILGVGNLGRLYANCLSNCPNPPPITLVVHRKELLSHWLQGDGIEITRLGVHTKNKIFDVEWWTEEPPPTGIIREIANGGKLRNLIISTKASAAMPETDRLRMYLDALSTVVFTQNGMSKLWPPHGPEYTINRYPPNMAPSFLSCVTRHGVLSQGAFKSIHTAPADVSIGSILVPRHAPPSVEYLIRQITTAPQLDAASVSTPDLWVLQLEKLIVNCIINPLTAVLRCKNGDLFTESSSPMAQVIGQLLEEASSILQSLISHKSTTNIITGSHASATSTTAEQDIALIRSSLTTRFSQPKLKEMLYLAGAKVAKNTSSMLQDVLAGKQTEIRDFNGWLVDTASFLDQGLDASLNQKMVQLVEKGEVLDANSLAKRLLNL